MSSLNTGHNIDAHKAIDLIALNIIKKDLLHQTAIDAAIDVDTHPRHKEVLDLLVTNGKDPSWMPPIRDALVTHVATMSEAIPNFDAIAAGRDLTHAVMREPRLRPFLERIKATSDAKIADYLAVLPASPGAGSTDAPEATDGSDSAENPSPYSPLVIPSFNRSVLASADRIMRDATNGSVSSIAALIDKLDEAQTFIAKNRSYVAPNERVVPANGPLPSGTARRMTAAAAFAGLYPPELAPNFAFDVTVYHWDAPHPFVPAAMPHFSFDPHVLQHTLWGGANGYNVVLYGPPGCGKTTFTEQLAARMGRPFFRIPVDGEMRKRDLIGGYKQVATDKGSEIRWYDGLLAKAIAMPSIIDIDEIDRADPDLQYVAHQAYERRGLTILEDEGRFIPPHPDHVILATANTKGRDNGDNPYQLRNEMSEATRDRFALWLTCTYMAPEIETAQLAVDCPTIDRDSIPRLVKFANLMRGGFADNKMSTTCSYRQLLAAARLTAAQTGLMPAREAEMHAIKMILIGRIPLPSDVATGHEYARLVYGAAWLA